MLKFDANVTALYPRVGLLDSLAAAAADGFAAVEMRAPYGEPVTVLADALRALELSFVQFNLPMGDFAAGDRGIACLPGREEEFRDGLESAITYATALGVPQVNCLAGLVGGDADPAVHEVVLIMNLRLAAARLGSHGIRLQVEPVNRRDFPGTFLATTADFERIAGQVAAPNLYLQYDFYHMQIMQGDLIPTFQRLQHVINHVQVADTPGRHEPGTGEISYDFVFAELQRLRYAGWIGCEYLPCTTVREGLGWMVGPASDLARAQSG